MNEQSEYKKPKELKIYTDGACTGNPGPGGWAAVLMWDGKIHEISGGEIQTTNNRMELLAAIKSLETLDEKCRVTLYSDSQYVCNGITNWIHGWKRKNWRRSGDKMVKNVDLWQYLDTLNQQHYVTWVWVRGHSGDFWNERADELARNAIPRI